MKLVSFWIENFMNIQNQGINLGDEMYFEYFLDNESRVLTISGRYVSEYFDLFSGCNVLNISGIIGSNGAGKTSVLKFLNVINNQKPIISAAIFIFYDLENKYYVVKNYQSVKYKVIVDCHDSIRSLIHNTDPSTQVDANPFHGIDVLFFSSLYSDQDDSYLKQYDNKNRSVDYQTRISLSRDRVRGYLKEFETQKNDKTLFLRFNVLKLYFEDRFKRLIDFLSYVKVENNQLDSIISEVPFPKYFTVNFRDDFYDRATDLKNNSSWDFNNIEPLIEFVERDLRGEPNPATRFKKELSFKLFLFAFHDDVFKHVDPERSLNELSDFINGLALNNQLYDTLINYLASNKSKNRTNQLAFLNVIFEKLRDNKYQLTLFTEAILPNWPQAYSYKIEVTDKAWEFIRDIYNLQEIELDSLLRISWPPLSAGQVAILNQFAELKEGFDSVTQEYALILIDEGELYLHPEWQRNYINFLIKLFTYLNSKAGGLTKMQLILTSHSPFIVSDIPKFSLSYLYRPKPTAENKFTEMKVLSPDEHKPTFGSNIFELLADSFFLTEGTIGEFSKNEINKVIRELLDKKAVSESRKDYLKKFISAIGESAVRNKLLHMLKEKLLKDSI